MLVHVGWMQRQVSLPRLHTEHRKYYHTSILTRTFKIDNINVDDVAQKQRSNFC